MFQNQTFSSFQFPLAYSSAYPTLQQYYPSSQIYIYELDIEVGFESSIPITDFGLVIICFIL